MSSRAEPRRSPGQRAGLSHDVVLGAARRIAERDGIERLTMRRLAADLGVMPNALYSYFRDKDDLLDALLDSLLGDIDVTDLAGRHWRAGLVELMDASRRLLLAHPQLIPLFLSRPTRGRNAARLGEVTLGLLRRGGLDGEQAVEALRVLLVYSLGFAAWQAPRVQEGAERTQRSEEAFGSLPDEAFPEMVRLATEMARHATDRDFLTGLGWLLDGIARARPPSDT